MEPAAGIAPASPHYGCGSLLLTYTGVKGAVGAAPTMTVLQTAAFAGSPRARKVLRKRRRCFLNSLAERAGVEPAGPRGAPV